MTTLILFVAVALAAATAYLLYLLSLARNEQAAVADTLRKEREVAERRRDQDRDTITALEADNARLARWEAIADADEEASRILQEARREVERAVSEADRIRAAARDEATDLIAEARSTAAALMTDSRQRTEIALREAADRVQTASAQAAAIVEGARQRAEEVAGKALRALETAEENERTVKALQNIIDGYGDQYVIPSRNLLDDLADEVGYAEAGQELKLVRDRIRDMVRTQKAAVCDYVEQNRRDTAIRFVTDAFNGKADSILARVKHDNAGTLQREMRDAFALVNHNGRAFRNARITEEYLALRLEELRWAAVANEIKLQEREEQKRIKDQIREEEKARREYERAMRDASKEEEMLRRAMEKAEQQMARASEEQRTQFEAQIAELAERLKTAEERNQRALSMAQQTRRGHVYVISNIGSFGEHVYKIGLTRRLEPLDRIRELGDSSVPFEFDVHALIFSEDAPALENQLHKHFVVSQVNKVNPRKEFFRVDLAQIRSEIESLGLEAHWTMTAGAREYRETLAIERVIGENPAMREAWLSRQLTFDAAGDPWAEDETASRSSDIGSDSSLALPIVPFTTVQDAVASPQ